MPNGKRKRAATIPRDSMHPDKARDPVYRSLEGVLGQACRASRRAGGILVEVWRLEDGTWRFQERQAPRIPGAVLFAELRARWLKE